ncbi:DNA methyltransferase [Mycoplasma sp. ATU-Cv-508]|uniref:DNA-methyltransferase n=1 Tax=Mycoplasma sp. ATU-Cv-508 TaxID=2048001 RepID=UPI000FDDC04B
MEVLKNAASNKRTGLRELDNVSIFKKTVMEFNHRYSIDGLQLLKNVKNNCISVVFFDPQYRGVLDKLSYGNEGSRQIKRSKLQQMSESVIKKFIKQIDRVLVETGHLFLWIDKFHLCQGIAPWIRETDLSIVDMIVWNKDKMGMGYRTRRQSEYLLILQKPPIRAKSIWKTRNIRDVWTEKIENRTHPHQKPFNLQSTLINSVSNEGDIILDPAAGSFSVMAAAVSINRLFLGTDVGEDKKKYGLNQRKKSEYRI